MTVVYDFIFLIAIYIIDKNVEAIHNTLTLKLFLSFTQTLRTGINVTSHM